MEIKKEIQIDLDPADIEKLIREHFKEQYNLETINFNVDGVEDPTDWQARLPLTYKMTKVRCVGTELK